MAYYDDQPKERGYEKDYIYRKRTMNSYYAITSDAWESVMNKYRYNKYVFNCGKAEGEKGSSGCKFCGNCAREYGNTMDRIQRAKKAQ
jgi:hypothetical protein